MHARFPAFFDCHLCAVTILVTKPSPSGFSPYCPSTRWSFVPEVREKIGRALLPPEWLVGSEIVSCSHRQISLQVRLATQNQVRRVPLNKIAFGKFTSGPTPDAAVLIIHQDTFPGSVSGTAGSSCSDVVHHPALPTARVETGCVSDEGLNLSSLLNCGNRLEFTRSEFHVEDSAQFDSIEIGYPRYKSSTVTSSESSTKVTSHDSDVMNSTFQEIPNFSLLRLTVRLVRKLHREFNSSVWLCVALEDGNGEGLYDLPDEGYCTGFSDGHAKRRHTVPSITPDASKDSSDSSDQEEKALKHWPEDRAVVLKVVHKDKCEPVERNRLSNEARILRYIDHPNIVKLLSTVDSPSEQLLFLEYAPLGDLYDATAFKALHESAARWVVFQILLALREIHINRRLIHGDVKAKNILLFRDDKFFNQLARNSSNAPPAAEHLTPRMLHNGSVSVWRNVRVKLADFGLVQESPLKGEVLFSGLVGTQGFLAPELLKRQDYSCAIDMWSLGIVTFTLLAGYEPFFPSCDCLTRSIEFDPRYWKDISLECHDFVSGLLARDPEMRLSVEKGLRHPWITKEFIDPFFSILS